eukprot:CAMPEP_0113589144 /NCGR_PEP_ID=MMETSP0015_2-20120614/35919_1 /TAXON_ID=2838 /ORGANISM="Odontella" /LENGTH=48 /DNA_ID=CAMNT_0000495119 /DNA_START=418 /DNA_END=564 /DNA_ORIENTATION=+ /assembly_acc=CAM_ASM_000160
MGDQEDVTGERCGVVAEAIRGADDISGDLGISEAFCSPAAVSSSGRAR